jgi:hypothetical protein
VTEPTNPVVFCNLCNNYAAHKLVHTQAATTGRGNTFDQNERRFELSGAFYYVAVCETCKGIKLYWAGIDNPVEPEAFYRSELIWPKPLILHESIPRDIADRCFIALRVKDNPDSFAVEIRRALELICIQQGVYKDNNLKAALERLLSKHVLCDDVAEISKALRHFGNRGAHATGEVTSHDVPILEEFFRIIVDHIYVSPIERKQKQQQIKNAVIKAKDISHMSGD